MAAGRPNKLGLDYYSINTDIESDPAFECLIAEYGALGRGVVVGIWTCLYNDKGYWMHFPPEEVLFQRFAAKNQITVPVLADILNLCFRERIFDPGAFAYHKILTSRGIQKRYLEASWRRKSVPWITEIDLIGSKLLIKYDNLIYVSINDINVNNKPINANSNIINVSNNAINVSDTPIYVDKVKESKVKEKKVNEIKNEQTDQSVDNSTLKKETTETDEEIQQQIEDSLIVEEPDELDSVNDFETL